MPIPTDKSNLVMIIKEPWLGTAVSMEGRLPSVIVKYPRDQGMSTVTFILEAYGHITLKTPASCTIAEVKQHRA